MGATASGAGSELVAGFAAQHGMATSAGQHAQCLAATWAGTGQVGIARAESQGATASSKLKIIGNTVFIRLIIACFGNTAKRFLFFAQLGLQSLRELAVSREDGEAATGRWGILCGCSRFFEPAQ